MTTPQPYVRHITAIRFLPDASNWRDVCRSFGDERDYSGPEYDAPPPFLDVRNDTIRPGEWLVIGDREFEVLSETEFNSRYKVP